MATQGTHQEVTFEFLDAFADAWNRHDVAKSEVSLAVSPQASLAASLEQQREPFRSFLEMAMWVTDACLGERKEGPVK
jgi:hypothetical protein